MLRRIALLITSLFLLLNLNAQEKGSLKLGIETGFLDLSKSQDFGVFLNVEPKLKSSKNTVIGLRIGFALNSQTIENKDSLQFYIDDISDNGTLSFIPTFDYYFYRKEFRAYAGLGVGYHLLGNPIEVSQIRGANRSEGIIEVSVDKQVGFLLRGGIELSKLRLGLEYNFIPKGDIRVSNNQLIGTVDISYLGLSVGFAIGDWNSSK